MATSPELQEARAMADDFIEALQDIAEAKGSFKRDRNEHCRQCLQEAQARAVNILRKWDIKPRREDDVIDGNFIPYTKAL